MRLSRVILLYVAAVVLLALGSCGYFATRPDLLLNPINRQIYLAHLDPNPAYGKGWYTLPIDLVPQNFAVGEPITAAERRLADAGYKSYAVTEIGPSWLNPTAAVFQRRRFLIQGTTFLIACEDYLVELHASDGRLLSASATKRHNRCAM